ncbi:Transcription factor GATA plant protein [Dioscorea alata]|uniref:Transcription factor GATA plant protein n=2 Tax=Dioscorea alata TaxID=55571 RepID=A0ACB7UBF3_DIOAL|nr:Transcription factor GATA plant protein [Dioscorea alata]KAH7657654.1 Transcription factor GATA plant protein [Dioscorea alata]
MEAPEYLHGGLCRGGGSQYPADKQGDQFAVEDLLDFSNEDDDEEEPIVSDVHADEGGSHASGGSSRDSSSASMITAVDSCNSSLSGYGARFSGEFSLSDDLCEPVYDELADLEWLSNLVEESFSSEDMEKFQLISGIKASSASSPADGDVSAAAPQPRFLPETPVPGKARSKRSRAAPCNWSSRLLALSPLDSPTADASAASPAAVAEIPVKKPTAAKKKKDPSEGPTYAASDGRKCLHCQTEKTPQWRTGPMGPKTLCNACGVRYKSGRLVPEYRPASSPTFVLSKHSNSHRKVLELRRQKDLLHQQQFLISTAGGYDSVPGDDFLIHHRIGPDFRQLI